MTLLELENQKGNDKITYNDLLRCVEWKNKRKEILERDNKRCTICEKIMTSKMKSGDNVMYIKLDKEAINNGENVISDVPVHLEVHHKYYVLNRHPWEYNNEALLSVCRECHQNIHSENKIYVFDEKMMNKLEFGECSRCSGKGYLPEYNHVEGGRCFKCGGSGQNVPFKYKSKE